MSKPKYSRPGVLSNQNPVLNRVLSRWLELPRDLAPTVDCERCTMSLNDRAHERRWHEYKCCAFQPFLANFICGAMLESGIALPPIDAGKVQLQAIGIVPTQAFRSKVEMTPDEKRGEEHLCTFYDKTSRRCSIWEFRPGECSLYYCGSDPKRAEREQNSLNIFAMESGLAQMALAYMGFSPEAISSQVDVLNKTGAELPSLHAREALELYRATWNWAKSQTIENIDSWLAFDNEDDDG